MPQKESHYQILPDSNTFMETVLIQKGNNPVKKNSGDFFTKKTEQINQNQPNIKWEDLAGLPWILLKEGR